MDAKELPARPSLEQYKKQAKDLVKVFKDFRARQSGDHEAIQRIKKYHARLGKLPEAEIRNAKFALSDAQLVMRGSTASRVGRSLRNTSKRWLASGQLAH